MIIMHRDCHLEVEIYNCSHYQPLFLPSWAQPQALLLLFWCVWLSFMLNWVPIPLLFNISLFAPFFTVISCWVMLWFGLSTPSTLLKPCFQGGSPENRTAIAKFADTSCLCFWRLYKNILSGQNQAVKEPAVTSSGARENSWSAWSSTRCCRRKNRKQRQESRRTKLKGVVTNIRPG